MVNFMIFSEEIKFTHDSFGELVLQQTIKNAKAIFNSRLVASYALGSLAHGGFSPLVSDVDIAIILEDPITINDMAKINSIQESVKSSVIPLSERLSIFWGSLNSLQGNADIGRFPPLDKLDLIENGRLLIGRDIRHILSKPTKIELVVMGAHFALQMLNTQEVNEDITHSTNLYKKGVRSLTKTILFPVRLLYTSSTGKIGHNKDSVEFYLTNNQGKKAKLVAAAFNWRCKQPENEAETVELTDKTFVELYVQFIDEYYQKMIEYNETIVANDLAKWREALVKHCD